MTDDERALSAALHDMAGHGPSGSPPISRLLSRGRRRRHTRSAFACAIGVTGAGVLTALASAGPGAGTSADTASGAHGATTRPGPVALSLAAERTDAGPFHFSLTSKAPDPGGKAGEPPRTGTSEGAFDPSTLHGYTQAVGGGVSAQSIRIGDTCYSQPTLGAPWLRFTCSASASGTSFASLTQDPATALKQLEAAGRATYAGRTGSGSGEVDTWKFTFGRNARGSAGSGTIQIGYTVTGTATVGVADGHIAAIDYTVTTAPNPIVAHSVTDVSITFSDYGAPVRVSAPDDSIGVKAP